MQRRQLSNRPDAISFSSNDYLGLSQHPVLLDAGLRAAHDVGTGSQGSRLLGGNYRLLSDLETAISQATDKSSLVFNSGYHANVALLSSLPSANDLIVMDKLCHASLIDGARLSPAPLKRFRHNDMAHLITILETANYDTAWIVTESLFSMDGDRAPLVELASIKQRFNAKLIVDEAHAVGCFGANSMGLSEQVGVMGDVDVLVGTFGKAFASMGAFVATSSDRRDYLVNTARPFIYSTALPPFAVGVVLGCLENQAMLHERRVQLCANAAYCRELLGDLAMPGEDYIVPVLVGDPKRALALAETCQPTVVTAIRHPTVPKGTDRIRLSVTAGHERGDIEAVCTALKMGINV